LFLIIVKMYTVTEYIHGMGQIAKSKLTLIIDFLLLLLLALFLLKQLVLNHFPYKIYKYKRSFPLKYLLGNSVCTIIHK